MNPIKLKHAVRLTINTPDIEMQGALIKAMNTIQPCNIAGREFLIQTSKKDGSVFTACLFELDREIFEKKWDGEGLPPIGTICERRTHAEVGGRYEQVRIIAYTSKGFAVWENTDGMFAGVAKENMFIPGVPAFRPIRTPEQIAAEEREAAIGEMMTFLGGEGSALRDTFTRMYDAGYRKQSTDQ